MSQEVFINFINELHGILEGKPEMQQKLEELRGYLNNLTTKNLRLKNDITGLMQDDRKKTKHLEDCKSVILWLSLEKHSMKDTMDSMIEVMEDENIDFAYDFFAGEAY